ncbi:hypothetical protein GRI62_14380 [Erythrobacter arachoides]|uniref:Uncharacterized protein n=1 Tax=Aurantiacibacter arachoides TaxID=1850444 RepID=A0A845A3W4_9SPHN|nr:hypothetical protein [Aurantiacibacter arachoides]MXO94785.1 hypothetical protein [Aurantiacibacter arachoides]GGD60730.1 hypothetical protein GCM10011411_21150 [Aurantiacibacter arachoides]
MLLKLAALGGLGYLGYRYYEKNIGRSPAAYAQGETGVRNAGPAAMRDKPDTWDSVSEASDASFPASDATAKY